MNLVWVSEKKKKRASIAREEEHFQKDKSQKQKSTKRKHINNQIYSELKREFSE